MRTFRLRLQTAVLAATALAVVVLALVAGASGSAVAAPRSTGTACRAVGGSTVSSPGPHRATVVVDTGSGAVWSACVSFSGTISGIDAIEAAAAQIPDLDPVYDVYTGQGRAVCKLRGVGNDPPDCLGKSAAYWQYFHDGTYWRSGAGSTTLADGDVDGWRWSSSDGAPRAASNGYQAVAVTAPPPTTTVVATTTRPTGSGHAGGGLTVTPGAPGTSGTTAPTGTGGGATTTTVRPEQTTTTGRPGATTLPGASGSARPGAAPGAGPGAKASGGVGQAADHAAPGSPSGRSIRTIATTSARHDSSGAGSALGFAAALAVVAAAGVALRFRRRRLAAADGTSPPLT